MYLHIPSKTLKIKIQVLHTAKRKRKKKKEKEKLHVKRITGFLSGTTEIISVTIS